MEHSHLIQRDSDESEDESERGGLQLLFGLQLNIQKTKIKASSPITSWQIDEETEKAGPAEFRLRNSGFFPL